MSRVPNTITGTNALPIRTAPSAGSSAVTADESAARLSGLSDALERFAQFGDLVDADQDRRRAIEAEAVQNSRVNLALADLEADNEPGAAERFSQRVMDIDAEARQILGDNNRFADEALAGITVLSSRAAARGQKALSNRETRLSQASFESVSSDIFEQESLGNDTSELVESTLSAIGNSGSLDAAQKVRLSDLVKLRQKAGRAAFSKGAAGIIDSIQGPNPPRDSVSRDAAYKAILGGGFTTDQAVEALTQSGQSIPPAAAKDLVAKFSRGSTPAEISEGVLSLNAIERNLGTDAASGTAQKLGQTAFAAYHATRGLAPGSDTYSSVVSVLAKPNAPEVVSNTFTAIRGGDERKGIPAVDLDKVLGVFVGASGVVMSNSQRRRTESLVAVNTALLASRSGETLDAQQFNTMILAASESVAGDLSASNKGVFVPGSNRFGISRKAFVPPVTGLGTETAPAPQDVLNRFNTLLSESRTTTGFNIFGFSEPRLDLAVYGIDESLVPTFRADEGIVSVIKWNNKTLTGEVLRPGDDGFDSAVGAISSDTSPQPDPTDIIKWQPEYGDKTAFEVDPSIADRFFLEAVRQFRVQTDREPNLGDPATVLQLQTMAEALNNALPTDKRWKSGLWPQNGNGDQP